MLREPDAARLFQVLADAEVIRKRNPDLPPALCQSIGLLALCHQSPASEEPLATVYTLLARQQSRVFMTLMARLNRAFPYLNNIDVAVAEAKNDLSTATTA